MFHSIIIIFFHKFTHFKNLLKAHKTQNTFGICSLLSIWHSRKDLTISVITTVNGFLYNQFCTVFSLHTRLSKCILLHKVYSLPFLTSLKLLTSAQDVSFCHKPFYHVLSLYSCTLLSSYLCSQIFPLWILELPLYMIEIYYSLILSL